MSKNSISTEYIAVENNSREQTITLVPEFVQEPYRGSFHVFINEDNTLSVLNTSFTDEFRAQEAPTGGTVKLCWMEAHKNSGDICISLPRQRFAEVKSLSSLAAAESGFIYLQMRRTEKNGDISFTDDFLGEVHLQFRWKFAAALPQPDSKTDIVAAAAVIVDEDGTVCDIVQQQFGIPELWIPPEESSDSSASHDKSDSTSKDDEESESSSSESKENEKDDDEEITDDFLRPVLVKLYYYEEGTEYYDEGESESWIYEVEMSGTFIADHSQYVAEYTVSLEGAGTMTDKDTGHVADLGIIFTVKFTRDESANLWKMTSQEGHYEWWVDNTTVEEGVKVIDVTLYSFPALDTNPTAPLDTIRVEKTINTNQKITSSFRMTFTQQ